MLRNSATERCTRCLLQHAMHNPELAPTARKDEKPMLLPIFTRLGGPGEQRLDQSVLDGAAE
jgi:hypothetical protein